MYVCTYVRACAHTHIHARPLEGVVGGSRPEAGGRGPPAYAHTHTYTNINTYTHIHIHRYTLNSI